MGLRILSAGGLIALIAMAWALSENRRAIPWRLVAYGLALQFAVGLLILKGPWQQALFDAAAGAVNVLTRSALEGARFVFGTLPENPDIKAVFAFQVLPVIIFVSALSAVLHHLGVIQAVVRGIAWLMRRTLKTSGAETFCAALLIFLGIEAATAVRGYLRSMTRSEVCVIMTAFMATIAGSVMVVYATFGAQPGHLLTASLMSAPAAILIAKMMVPETETPRTSGAERVEVTVESHNVMDAAVQGTSQGLNMALHVGATVIVFIGLVYLIDLAVAGVTGHGLVSLLGYVFRPFAVLLGVPRGDIAVVSELLATKTVLNEFLGYVELQQAIQGGQIGPRAQMIATYALCGFSNPGSIGIAIAGLSALVPERRAEFARLGVKSFIGGTLACFMTACVAGALAYE